MKNLIYGPAEFICGPTRTTNEEGLRRRVTGIAWENGLQFCGHLGKTLVLGGNFVLKINLNPSWLLQKKFQITITFFFITYGGK